MEVVGFTSVEGLGVSLPMLGGVSVPTAAVKCPMLVGHRQCFLGV